jgi:hypothetical protein
MTKWLTTAAFAALMLGVIDAACAEAAQKAQSSRLTGVSARPHDRRHDHRYVYRPYDPHYYGRPQYYSPRPFLPLPPLFGYGWGLW